MTVYSVVEITELSLCVEIGLLMRGQTREGYLGHIVM